MGRVFKSRCLQAFAFLVYRKRPKNRLADTRLKFAAENLRLLELAEALRAPGLNASGVKALVQGVCDLYGAIHWIFSSFLTTRYTDRDGSRFLLGCPPSWCQIYQSKFWQYCDPAREYARFRTTPLPIAELRIEGEGQTALMEYAQQFGFVDGFIVPAHTPNDHRVGILYIAYEEVGTMPLELFEGTKIALQAVSSALVDWDFKEAVAEVRRETRLNATECQLLAGDLRGHQSKEIALHLDMTLNAVNRGFRSAINKLGVANKHEAAQMAKTHGILPNSYP